MKTFSIDRLYYPCWFFKLGRIYNGYVGLHLGLYFWSPMILIPNLLEDYGSLGELGTWHAAWLRWWMQRKAWIISNAWWWLIKIDTKLNVLKRIYDTEPGYLFWYYGLERSAKTYTDWVAVYAQSNTEHCGVSYTLEVLGHTLRYNTWEAEDLGLTVMRIDARKLPKYNLPTHK